MISLDFSANRRIAKELGRAAAENNKDFFSGRAAANKDNAIQLRNKQNERTGDRPNGNQIEHAGLKTLRTDPNTGYKNSAGVNIRYDPVIQHQNPATQKRLQGIANAVNYKETTGQSLKDRRRIEYQSRVAANEEKRKAWAEKHANTYAASESNLTSLAFEIFSDNLAEQLEQDEDFGSRGLQREIRRARALGRRSAELANFKNKLILSLPISPAEKADKIIDKTDWKSRASDKIYDEALDRADAYAERRAIKSNGEYNTSVCRGHKKICEANLAGYKKSR